jgi:hypothetical protein
LLSLTLSHNYLSGEIPLWLQQKNLSHLDLSHNKLTGDANGFRHQDLQNSDLLNAFLGSRYVNRSLALTVNRLSGDLPDSFGKYANLDILNLFGCAHVPKNDESSDSVSCGSKEYDQTLLLMGGVLGTIVCLAASLYLLRMFFSSLRSLNEKKSNDTNTKRFPSYHLSIHYLNYGNRVRSSSQSSIPSFFPHSSEKEINTALPSSLFPSTVSFGNLLSRLMRSVCVLTTLCLFF